MKISRQIVANRRVWKLDNSAVTLTVMEGGGHLSALVLNEDPGCNPLWRPHWPTIEPWRFRREQAGLYQIPLLASIHGHNICFGHFGEASPEEFRAGLRTHGEAPVIRWEPQERGVSRRGLTFVYGCRLPVAQMTLTRRIYMPRGARVIHVRETIRNLSRRDTPFGLCQHVTFGAPFVEPGKTVFDMTATRGHTFPGVFGAPQRLKKDTAFTWPHGPGSRGRPVDLRTMRTSPNSDFSAQLMDPAREYAWFSAMHPGLRLLVAYVWKRVDFPWLGNWEENRARATPPWDGKALTRGMEFSTSPFPVGLRAAVEMQRFKGAPTYRWLPARGILNVEYSLMITRVETGCRGVRDIDLRQNGDCRIDFR